MWKTILKFVNDKISLSKWIRNNLDIVVFFRLYLT